MKKLQFIALFLLLTQNSFAASSRNLTVFTEPHMALALTKIAREFSRKNDATISVNFDLSSDLLHDIDSGEPVDVLISANSEIIEALKNKGLVDVHSAGYVAADSLVLVTNKLNTELNIQLQQAPSLEQALKILDQELSAAATNAVTNLLTDSAGHSSGKFANDLLNNLQLTSLKALSKIPEDKSSIIGTARKSGDEFYALLLTSQIKNENGFTILSTKKDSGIFYQALVIAGDNMEVGREFVKFLKTDAARKIFTNAGFESLDKN